MVIFNAMAANQNEEDVYGRMLEEIFTDMAFQVEVEMHVESSIQSEVHKYIKKEDLATNPFDIFNNGNSKDSNECVCPNCGRTLGALRFAPHLEKCVGMGRSSSRIASRRILASSNSGKEGKYSDEISDGNGGGSQSSNPDWGAPRVTKRVDMRRRKDRAARHHKNRKKVDETMPSISEEGEKECRYDVMSLEQRQSAFSNMCGVVSEHTGKMCTRSIRCPKHTEEQRNNVRLTYLNIGAVI